MTVSILPIVEGHGEVPSPRSDARRRREEPAGKGVQSEAEWPGPAIPVKP
jgi:hypothetical protein